MNIEQTLDELGISWQLGGQHRHVTPGWLGISPCPSCGSSEYHCGIHLTTGHTSCWRCGSMPLINTLAQVSGRHWSEVKKLLGDWQRVEIDYKPRGHLKIPAGVGPLEKAHISYLKGRGYDPDQLVKLWGIKGIGLAPRLPWRIWIPVTLYGRTVSWTTRSIKDDGVIRYISAAPEDEEVAIKTLLGGEDYARHSVMVVEGPTSGWKIGPGAVWTFGMDYTRAQVSRIARFPVRTIAFDNDPPKAQQQADKLCAELSCLPGKTNRIEIDADDPGKMSERDVSLLRKSFLD
jgi:hypothetical protein